ncbi:MAG: hypothetical protein N3A54_02810 [Patescibacteria group bacterium]|nr:hypothetical protein [Patescibacteria group bacterium]
MSKKIFSFLFVLVPFVFAGTVVAAPPDGLGPWADSVVSTQQGLRKNGTPVLPIRSNPDSALGVAENNTIEGNFYSLGFGGRIVLQFDNHQSGGVLVVESTNPNYPLEKARVEVSENGATWTTAGTVTQDGEVSVPQGFCVKYVRITDISDPSDFSDDTADGYDVDGVMLKGKACSPKSDGGETTIIVKNEKVCEMKQNNTTIVSIGQSSVASTGRNIIKIGTKDHVMISTGRSGSKNSAKFTDGSNIAVNPCACCTE